MTLFCDAFRRDSVPLLKFPFLSHVQVLSCEMLFISRLKRPSCFPSHFCFPVIVILLLIVLSVYFLMAVISPRSCFSMKSSKMPKYLLVSFSPSVLILSWFGSSILSVRCCLPLFSTSMEHFSMPNSIPMPWLYILTACIRVYYCYYYYYCCCCCFWKSFSWKLMLKKKTLIQDIIVSTSNIWFGLFNDIWTLVGLSNPKAIELQ